MKIQLIFLLSVVCALSNALANEISLTDSVKKYKFLAKTARQQNDFQEAIRLYRNVTFFDSNDQKAWFFLGECLYRSKAFVEAKTAFISALNIDSLHVNSNIRLYSILSNESDFESAARALERVLIAKPQSVEYRWKLADLYRHQGESGKSIFHYEAILNDKNDIHIQKFDVRDICCWEVDQWCPPSMSNRPAVHIYTRYIYTCLLYTSDAADE